MHKWIFGAAESVWFTMNIARPLRAASGYAVLVDLIAFRVGSWVICAKCLGAIRSASS